MTSAPNGGSADVQLSERRLVGVIIGPLDEAGHYLEHAIQAGVTANCFSDHLCRTVFALAADRHAKGLPHTTADISVSLDPATHVEIGGLQAIFLLEDAAKTGLHFSSNLGVVMRAATARTVARKLAHAKDAAEQHDLPRAMELAIDALHSGDVLVDIESWSPAQFFAAETRAEDVFLGDGLLERGTLTSFVGAGGLGKTRLTVWLTLCWLVGRDWCGLKTRGGPGKVLFLSSETGIRRWKHDLKLIMASFSSAEQVVIEKHFRAVPMTPGTNFSLWLGDPANVASLRARLKKEKPVLLVIDPFAEMIEGDESKTEHMVATLRVLRAVLCSSCPEAAVLLIHHARTGAANVMQAGDLFNAGNFARGSKALYNGVRGELQLAPADKDDPNRLVLACGKNNDGPKFAARGVRFNPMTFAYDVDGSFNLDEWRSDVSGQRTGKSVSIADVVGIVRELAPSAGDETTTGRIQKLAKERFGCSTKTIGNRLAGAFDRDYLCCPKKGIYRLGSKPLPKR